MRASRETGLYLLNHKRDFLLRLELSHGLFVNVVLDDTLAQADHQIERISSTPFEAPPSEARIAPPEALDPYVDDEIDEDEDEDEIEEDVADGEAEPQVRESRR